MRLFAKISLVAMVIFICGYEAAAKMPVPGRTGSWVNDYAGIIPGDLEAYLERFLDSVPQKTPEPVEIIVATFSTIEGWNIGDFARSYGERWRAAKLGARDNGVILLYIQDRGELIIGVGVNLKGILTDETAASIISDTAGPFFSCGEYAAGIIAAAREVSRIISNSTPPSERAVLNLYGFGFSVISVAIFFIMGSIIKRMIG